MSWNPEADSVTHINIYSRGKTALGRFLSNFALSPFVHPKYGDFQSVEGFWYWYATGQKHDVLRHLFGSEAKSVGRSFERVHTPVAEFEKAIQEAITAKLRQNPIQLNLLIDSTLPLTHYYVQYGKSRDAGYEWITEYIEYVRKTCQDKGWRAYDGD